MDGAGEGEGEGCADLGAGNEDAALCDKRHRKLLHTRYRWSIYFSSNEIETVNTSCMCPVCSDRAHPSVRSAKRPYTKKQGYATSARCPCDATARRASAWHGNGTCCAFRRARAHGPRRTSSAGTILVSSDDAVLLDHSVANAPRVHTAAPLRSPRGVARAVSAVTDDGGRSSGGAPRRQHDGCTRK
jgi:hypothetical protein